MVTGLLLQGRGSEVTLPCPREQLPLPSVGPRDKNWLCSLFLPLKYSLGDGGSQGPKESQSCVLELLGEAPRLRLRTFSKGGY